MLSTRIRLNAARHEFIRAACASAVGALAVGLAPCSARASERPEVGSVEVLVSPVTLGLFFGGSGGVRVLENLDIGIEGYQGGYPFMMSARRFGGYARYHTPILNFFITARAGHLETEQHGPPPKRSAGLSVGLDIGSRWAFSSGFTHGITWASTDAMVKHLAKGEAVGLVNVLKYELGWTF